MNPALAVSCGAARLNSSLTSWPAQRRQWLAMVTRSSFFRVGTNGTAVAPLRRSRARRPHSGAWLQPSAVREASGEIKPGSISKDFSQHACGAHFAEVAVDIDTGEIRLRRMLGVFAAGRILNEKLAKSQAVGAMLGAWARHCTQTR